MKRFLIAASVLMAGMTVSSAFAFENQFSGEFRTRAYSQRDFGFKDAYLPGEIPSQADRDVSQVDTRTRLFYTAKFSENFKLVNGFEMGDQVWGQDSYTDIGADGVAVEVKHTYADFTPVDNLNFKIGTQAGFLSRGFMFDDDFSGAVVTFDAGSAKIPFMWMKYNEGGMGKNPNTGKDANDDDQDAYVLNPEIAMGNLTINPMIMYMTQESTDLDVYYLGLNADMKTDALTAWFTGIYQGGETGNLDNSAYLAAVGADVALGQLGVHGQVFYASGDDDVNDTDDEAFLAPAGRSYYWAEIMGYGIFDNQVSNGSPADCITNITAANIGVSFKPMDKLTLGADVWYAMLNEVATGQDDELGTEIDLKAQYMIFDNLALDLVGAYLVAGDATGEDDPYEIGTQLILKF